MKKNQKTSSVDQTIATRLEALLNAIAANLPMADKSDLTCLTMALTSFEEMASLAALPPAFRGIATRAAQLAEHVMMGETEFDPGIRKLNESVEKMRSSVKTLAKSVLESSVSGGTAGDGIAPACAAKAEDASALNDNNDMGDLVLKFAAQQQSHLEDLEAYCLELEKGDPQARSAIKRMLHTLKGELGVLGMQDYAKLVHEVEGALENNAAGADGLLQVRDFLGDRFRALSEGRQIPVTTAEIELLLNAFGTTIAAVAVSSPAAMPEAQKTPPPAANPDPVPTSGENAFSGDPSLMGDFIAESRDHLDKMDPLLLELEMDATHAENLNSVFRGCHTIKGVASFLALKDVSSLAHSMENLMDLARRKEITLSPDHIDLLLESVDCLRSLIASIEVSMNGGVYAVPPNYAAVRERLSSPMTVRRAPDAPRPGEIGKKVGEILIDEGKVTPEAVAGALTRQKEGDQRKLGEILMDEASVPARAVGAALASQSAGKQAGAVEETIRVPINRLDQLIDTIGEAVIAQSMVYADPAIKGISNLALEKKMAQAGLIMRQIQELSMSLRMVSIKGTFQKMARLVRDLSKKVDKDVEFIMEGEDTELDKSVVENIGDPLIHMIRNSLDHGIEDTARRLESGKPAKSKVALRAYHKAGNVCIEIEDDGRGLDREGILNKAVSKGLCKATDKLTDQEIYQFIFMPGFSTAREVTDISGRGVGMDVVRRNIQSLRGAVDIQTELGKGTLFTIRLPLTLAIINGMVVRLGEDRYIVPTLSILESIKPSENQLETVAGKGEIIKVRGDLLRLVRLHELFRTGGDKKRVRDTNGIALIVEDALGKKMGLFVDEIVDQQQVVIKNLGDGLGEIPGVSGGAIMSDGTVSLILDVGGIAKIAGG